MTEDAMDKTYALLREGGCHSVHIGGGEPFLNFEGLLTLCEKGMRYGVLVDYVETNASWATDEDTIKRKLSALKKARVDTLCISIDPYHAEYVPYANPLRLAEVCQKVGFGFFLWQQRFVNMLRNTDPHTAHTRAALEKTVGKNYVSDTASAYGIRFGGRAVQIEMENATCKPVDELLKGGTGKRCDGLVDTGHFHVDMYNRFIPPGCTGFVIPMEDVVRGIPDGKYPVFEASYTGGTAALYELAKAEGFIADAAGYATRCQLCFFMRKYLSETGKFAELDAEFFVEAMRY